MTKGSGYVAAHRSVFDNPVFRSDAEAMAFIYLVMKAAWAPARVRYKGRTVELQRGQLAMSVRDFAAAMERSRQWAERYINRVSRRDMIETDAGTGVNIITICNYEKYQGLIEQAETEVRQQPRQHRDSTETQNNKDKEDKERKKIPSPTPPKVETPDWLPAEAWEGWLEMRRLKRVPNTGRALNLAIGKLAKLKAKGYDPGKVLDEATEKGWQGIWEPSERRGDNLRTQEPLRL